MVPARHATPVWQVWCVGCLTAFAGFAAQLCAAAPAGDGAGAPRLSPVSAAPATPAASAPPLRVTTDTPAPSNPIDEPTVPRPSEFERLATDANGSVPVRRFGLPLRRPAVPVPSAEVPGRVPPGYVLQVGDEVAVTVWGSFDADWHTRIDRAGRIVLPRVGPLPVAGATVAELDRLVRTRLERLLRNFESSVVVTDVSPMRVHITGFVERPGDYIVAGQSTISQALEAARGPAAGGSWRRIRLVRNDKTEAVFDLYALLADGSRRNDRTLQPGDVLHVEPAGPQAALLGGVNRVAVFEFIPGETVADLLRLGGGLSTVADRTRLTLERLENRDSVGAVQLQLPRDAALALADGDIVHAISQVDAALPAEPRNKRVRVDGEVRHPGEYLLPPRATLADALAAAGGATPLAFLYGAELRRESVRQVQEQNYERALQELEAEIERAPATRSRDETGASDAVPRQLLARLRTRRPEGRMVLDVTPDATALPPMPLEDRDQLRVPASSRSIGVFGSVFNAGSFVHDGGRRLGDYLQRAGGPTAGADYRSAFVVRANGSVFSARQGGYWRGTERFENEAALPGDTVFVPEQVDRITWVQGAKDWTQILYQFGLGIAGLRVLR